MSMELRYDLYDTFPVSATVPNDLQLFKVAQNADNTHTEQYTNMRGAGFLPNNEKFVIDWIGCVIDDAWIQADDFGIFHKSFLLFAVQDQVLLKAPLARFIAHSAYGGFYTQTAAATAALIGLHGSGYLLDKPITLPGGVQFYVRLQQNVAASGTLQLKVIMSGIYTLP